MFELETNGETHATIFHLCWCCYRICWADDIEDLHLCLKIFNIYKYLNNSKDHVCAHVGNINVWTCSYWKQHFKKCAYWQTHLNIFMFKTRLTNHIDKCNIWKCAYRKNSTWENDHMDKTEHLINSPIEKSTFENAHNEEHNIWNAQIEKDNILKMNKLRTTYAKNHLEASNFLKMLILNNSASKC